MMLVETEYVVMEKQGRVYLLDILYLSSNDLYQSELHYSICEGIANLRSTSQRERKFLTNLYSLKSKLARYATALTYFILNSDSALIEINVSKRLLSTLDPRILVGVKVNEWLGSEPHFIEISHLLLLLAKSITHLIFRRFPKKIKREDSIVRGWVETTSKMYEREVREGLVLIYPFALNIRRQFNFVLWCIKNKIRFQLAGMQYPIWKIITQLFSSLEYDIILMHAELDANVLHGNELLALRPKVLFTSDEFETGIFVLYEKLISNGVYVVNTAHGVGQYCPYITYSEFRVISKSQSNFYLIRNPEIKFVNIDLAKNRINGIDSYKDSVNKPIAFVLIHQPFKESGCHAEHKVQQFLDKSLFECAELLRVRYFVKIHPNYKTTLLHSNQSNFNGLIVRRWEELNTFRLIFVTINSTVFFDLKGLAPVIVYAGSTFNPSIYFSNSLVTFDESNFTSKLKQLMDHDYWFEASSIHAEHESS